ncbi:MAG TPA: acylphosphatase [Coxiellaceae bacterium]|nr:acylphosphatase [Coxiellaceae bacterium]
MKYLCIQARVLGKVQGVFYRDSARKKAQSLGIVGWVKNDNDGSVSLHACGDAEKIKQFIEWLHQGPLLAKVSHVDWGQIPTETHEGFTIR